MLLLTAEVRRLTRKSLWLLNSLWDGISWEDMAPIRLILPERRSPPCMMICAEDIIAFLASILHYIIIWT